MIEEWRPIEGYEGLYEVSSYGRVRSLDRYDSMNRLRKGRILTLRNRKGGYLDVPLYSNNKLKRYLVHRLVSEAFIPNPNNLPEVNHINEDKTDNRVDNLEWCNRKYNVNYGTRKDRMRDTKIKNGTWTGLSKEEYSKKRYQEKKEKICEYQKEYYLDHKKKISEYQRDYNHKNREKRSEQQKEYYLDHKKKISEQKRKYYQENKDRICERQKEYYRKKKEEIQNNVKSLDDQI